MVQEFCSPKWRFGRKFQSVPVAPRSQPHPVTGFQATLRITPVVDGDRAFVEWWATFDCDPARREELTGTLRSSFGKWLESLRSMLGGLPQRLPPEEAAAAG
jgi:hypothetical protein